MQRTGEFAARRTRVERLRLGASARIAVHHDRVQHVVHGELALDVRFDGLDGRHLRGLGCSSASFVADMKMISLLVSVERGVTPRAGSAASTAGTAAPTAPASRKRSRRRNGRWDVRVSVVSFMGESSVQLRVVYWSNG